MIIIDAAIAPIDRKYTFPIIRVIHIRAINYRSLIRCNEPSLLVPRLDYNSGRVFDHLVAGRERERGNASGVACPEISGLVFIILDLSVFLPLFSRNFAFTIESNEQELFRLESFFSRNNNFLHIVGKIFFRHRRVRKAITFLRAAKHLLPALSPSLSLSVPGLSSRFFV